MPIWQVSLTDGLYQVADADGAMFPLTMNDVPISQFYPGWSPRGLHTGLAAFHVLELEHESGIDAFWLHDEALNYRANAVLGLDPDGQVAFFAEMDPVVRTLHDECVLAPQAAIPAVAHRFDGMLPETVTALLAGSIDRVLPRPDTVMLDGLADLGAGYASGGLTLPAAWIEQALSASDNAAQERFDLAHHRCQRHLDRATGRVFYRLQGDAAEDRHLYVPAANVVFSGMPASHEPLCLLLTYYAGTTNRVVSLTEAFDLSHEMIHPIAPPQHGLDEPTLETVPPAPASPVAVEPTVAYENEARTSFEAPLSDMPHPVNGTEAIDRAPEALREDASEPAAPPPLQNWWQRLLGLGNV